MLMGLVEVVLCVGLVDVIVDLVFIGVILEVNGFKEVEVIFEFKVMFIQCLGVFVVDKVVLIDKFFICMYGV